MREAWIHGDAAMRSQAASMLAELGFSPLHIGSADIPRAQSEAAQLLYPDIVLMLVDDAPDGTSSKFLRSLRADLDLREVPLVAAVHSARAGACIPCDEIIMPPLRIAELGVRIARARWRRGIVADDVIRLGSLDIDLAAYDVRLHGELLELTHTEYRLLELLATHPSRVYSRERLLSRMGGQDHAASARTVDGHVGRLRAKLGPEHGHRIHTVRNVGYRFGP